MFPGLKCPTKVKSGQTRKYILVDTVSLTVMLMSCLSRFFSTLLTVHWLCGCILLLAAFHFLLLYPFRHRHESVHVWSFSSVVLTRFYRFRPNQASRWLLEQPTKDVEHIKHKLLVAVFKTNPQSGNCITNGPFLQQSPSPCWPFTLRLH